MWKERLAPGSYQKTMEHHSGRTMRRWRQKQRRLAELFGTKLEVISFTSRSQVNMFLKDAQTIGEKTYHSAFESALRDNALWRSIVLEEAEHQRLRAYIMYGGGHPIAFVMGTVTKDSLVLDAIAHLPEYDKWSPGLLLLLHVCERACMEGLIWIDHGFGDAEHKRTRCTDSHIVRSMHFYGSGWAPSLTRCLSWTSNQVLAAARRALLTLGLLKSTKKRLRKAMAGTSEDKD
jgi:CelD/BcsL family acetyltransferase involved in cellulose biosynthesis